MVRLSDMAPSGVPVAADMGFSKKLADLAERALATAKAKGWSLVCAGAVAAIATLSAVNASASIVCTGKVRWHAKEKYS